MSLKPHFFKGLALIALLFGSAISAEPQRLSLDEARALGYRLLAQDRALAAEAIARGLLQADPGDNAALILLARAQIRQGRGQTGLETAQTAWSGSQTDTERYASATTIAQAHYALKQDTRAQIWLRRAAENAPTESARARIAQDYRQVRARNRWSTSLSFNVEPSSNVNNGTNADTLTLTFAGLEFESDVPDDDQALSGTAVSAGLATRYRMSQSERYALDGMLSLHHREVFLSGAAKDKAPEAENADFRQSVLSFGPRLTLRSQDRRTDVSFDASVGRVWYGGEPLYDTRSVGAMVRHFPTRQLALMASIDRTHEAGGDNRDDRDLTRIRLRSVSQLASGAQIGFSLGATESRSEAITLDHSQKEIGITFSPAKQVAGMSFEFGLSYSQRVYDQDFFSADGRTENTSEVSVTAVFDQLDYYGFVPSMTLSARRTDANVEIYDSEGLNLGVGFRSSF